MVAKEDIKNIFDNILNKKITVKCSHTVAEMREMLSNVPHEDQFTELKEKNLLNPLEVDDYQTNLNRYNNIQDNLNNPKTVELLKKNDMYDREVEEFELAKENLFKYGRRLIEGLHYNDVPTVDMDNFVQDTQYKRIKDLLENQGNLESQQVEQQKGVFTKDNVTESEKHSMDWYFCGDLNNLNKYIYGFTNIMGKHYNKKLDDEQKRNIKDIDNLMNRSPPLVQDTLLYRIGHWDIHLKPGDHGKWKGYTSTTYQEKVTDAYKEDHNDAMKMVILAPKGTKGITGYNPPIFQNDIGEHEYTLPRNTKYTVLDVDYDTMTATIILDE